MARDNPFRNLAAYNRVRIGGRLIKAALVAIDGNELLDDWNVQKGTNTSGATAAYRGVNLIEGVKLTFECANGDGSTAEQDYDDLSDLWDMLAPAPRKGLAGPKPPTQKIENAILNRIGLTDACRKAWKESPTATGSWLVELTLIQYAPPAPAGAGAQDPSKPATGIAEPTEDPVIKAKHEERDALAAQAAAV
jgi:hypothetical protein